MSQQTAREVEICVTRSDDPTFQGHYLLLPGTGKRTALRIGRAPENHVVLSRRGVSNLHVECRLAEEFGSVDGLQKGVPELLPLRVRDMSMNGTALVLPDGKKVVLDKGVFKPMPDGATLQVPAKMKKGEVDEAPIAITVRLGAPTSKDHQETEIPCTVLPPAASDAGEDLPDVVPVDVSSADLRDSFPVEVPPLSQDEPETENVELPQQQPRSPSSGSRKRGGSANSRSRCSVARDGSRSASSGHNGRSRGRRKKRKTGKHRSKSGKRRSKSGSSKRSRSRKRSRKRRRKRSRSRGSAMSGMPLPWAGGGQWQWGGPPPPWPWPPPNSAGRPPFGTPGAPPPGGKLPRPSDEVCKQQIYFMYQNFNPSKLPQLDSILEKYKGSEFELLQAMCAKYLARNSEGERTKA